jgi:hypothetical protein
MYYHRPPIGDLTRATLKFPPQPPTMAVRENVRALLRVPQSCAAYRLRRRSLHAQAYAAGREISWTPSAITMLARPRRRLAFRFTTSKRQAPDLVN